MNIYLLFLAAVLNLMELCFYSHRCLFPAVMTVVNNAGWNLLCQCTLWRIHESIGFRIFFFDGLMQAVNRQREQFML